VIASKLDRFLHRIVSEHRFPDPFESGAVLSEVIGKGR
jgi:hypothetical protein